MDQHANDPDKTGAERDPERPSAESPDSVPESVPSAGDRAGKVGPDAADPPRAGAPGDERAADNPELDADEGTDAFETPSSAQRKQRQSDAERQDEDHISIDTPD